MILPQEASLTPPPKVPPPSSTPSQETPEPALPSSHSPYEVSQVDRLPVAQGGISVPFPARARRQGVSGQVLVEFVVTPQGVPEQIRVVSASPPGYFEEAAREALEKARFQPALREGKPVPCRLQLPLVFRLSP